MKKYLTVAAAIFMAIAGATVFAQNAAEPEVPNLEENIKPGVLLVPQISAFESKNALGAYFILSVDDEMGGLEYQRWLTKRVGLEAELSLYYQNSSYGAKTFNYDLNCQADFNLYEFEVKNFASQLYAWVMMGSKGSIDYIPEVHGSLYPEDDHDAIFSFEPSLLAGFGFGFDLIFFRHLSIPVQMGYMGSFFNNTYLNFCFSSGIRYKF